VLKCDQRKTEAATALRKKVNLNRESEILLWSFPTYPDGLASTAKSTRLLSAARLATRTRTAGCLLGAYLGDVLLAQNIPQDCHYVRMGREKLSVEIGFEHGFRVP
jgi:hypothetical protein